MKTELVGLAKVAAIAALCLATLAAANRLTREQIEENRITALWQSARDITGINELQLSDPSSGLASREWRATGLCDGRVLRRTTVNGYGGAIEVLGVTRQASLLALRVSRHSETPGIGDFIGPGQTPWIRQFDGTTEATLESVDTVSGATVTRRAAIDAARQLVSDQTAAPMCWRSTNAPGADT